MTVRVGDWQWRNPLVSCAGGRKFIEPGRSIGGDAERRVRARGVARHRRQRAPRRTCGYSGQCQPGGIGPDPLQRPAGLRGISRHDTRFPVACRACGTRRRIWRRGGRRHARSGANASNAGGTPRPRAAVTSRSIAARKVRRQQVGVIARGLIAFPFPAALSFAVRHAVPPVTETTDTLAGLIFGMQCGCVAILFCFATGIDERSNSNWTDPMSGYQSRRIAINMRGLQFTFQQMPALPMLAPCCRDGDKMPAVVAGRSVQPAVAKCEIATVPRYNTLRSYSDPTTIHGDAGRGFGTFGATGAMPMGCI
jgi:hypothetical protein